MANELASLILWVLQALSLALIGRALLSWFDPGLNWSISRVLYEVTEPFVAPIRRVVPPVGMIDLSFIVAIVLLQVLRNLLARALLG